MTFSKNQRVHYQQKPFHSPQLAQILEIHHDGDQPYYTIKCLNDQHERQTNPRHLSPIPRKLFNKNYFKKSKRLLDIWKDTPYESNFDPLLPLHQTTNQTTNQYDSWSDLETIDLDEITPDNSQSSENSF